MSLKNKTAFITGSSRGIGKSVALKLASLGADIILHYRSNVEEAQNVEQELKNLGVKVWKYAADLSELDQVQRLIEEIKSQHSRLDIFVSNAAATAFKPLSEIKPHHIQKTFNITITTFMMVMNAFTPIMPEGSKVITVSGIDTKKYCVNHGLLAAAKAALEMLTRYYATELNAKKIFVHGINPGLVDTDSMKVYWGSNYEKFKAEFNRLNPMGGLMPTSDVAEMIAFLCTPAANWFNGETLYADGGMGFLMPVFSK